MRNLKNKTGCIENDGGFLICWKFKDLPYEIADNYIKIGSEVYLGRKRENDGKSKGSEKR